jgi:NTP pyrophosphatase (non-canonical NTP hydrolase)
MLFILKEGDRAGIRYPSIAKNTQRFAAAPQGVGRGRGVRSVIQSRTRATPGSDAGDACSGGGRVTIRELQDLIERMYSARDRQRGAPATFLWLAEEVGELASALREGTDEELSAEFADVMAWLVTLANVRGVDLTAALEAKYGAGCPGCGEFVCTCDAKP